MATATKPHTGGSIAVTGNPGSSLFRPAVRAKTRLRMALCGPAGAGKTFTALRLAFALASRGNGRVAVIDTEFGSAAKYQGESPDGVPWNFDVLELTSFSPSTYAGAIIEAGRLGYDALVVDSLSHAWQGTDGALELVTKKGGNSFTAWKDVTPMHNAMIESILRSPCHVIATMRSKMEYVLEENDKGRQVPRKLALAPIQRQGMEYEFDIVGDIDWTHTLTIGKSRCSAVDGVVCAKPTALFIQPVAAWLEGGAEVTGEMLAAAGIRAMTASELAASQARVEADAKAIAATAGNGAAAAKPELTPEQRRQQMQAAAAQQAANGASVGNGGVAPVASDSAPDPRVNQILGLAKSSGLNPTDLRKLIDANGGAGRKLAELDGPTLHSLLLAVETRARGIRQQQQPTPATTTPAPAAPAAPTPAAGSSPDKSAAPVTKELLARLKGLCERTGWGQERQVAWLTQRGMNSFRSLTIEQAEDLIDRLQKIEFGMAEKQPTGEAVDSESAAEGSPKN